MDTPETMRQRAELWRRLAAHHPADIADALIEAACELELRACQLERAPRPPAEPAPAKPAA